MDAGSAEDEASGNADINEVSTFEVGEIQNQHSVEDEALGDIQIAHVPKVAKRVRNLVEKIEGATADQALQNQHHANRQLPSFSKQGSWPLEPAEKPLEELSKEELIAKVKQLQEEAKKAPDAEEEGWAEDEQSMSWQEDWADDDWPADNY